MTDTTPILEFAGAKLTLSATEFASIFHRSSTRTVQIKALSIHQPWANEIAQGTKTIETRYWHTYYRGWLLICSTKRVPIEPRGCALAIAKLADCRPMIDEDEVIAGCPRELGVYAWCLNSIHAIWPQPIRGQPGLFDVVITVGEL